MNYWECILWILMMSIWWDGMIWRHSLDGCLVDVDNILIIIEISIVRDNRVWFHWDREQDQWM